jgi:uncharacterized membrane protein
MTVDQWAAVVGFALPALVAVINREPWKTWIKALVALLTSVLGGTVTALLAGQFTGSTWIQSVGIAFAASQAFYLLWWKKSGITDAIEQKVFAGTPPEPALGGAPGDSQMSGVHRAGD